MWTFVRSYTVSEPVGAIVSPALWGSCFLSSQLQVWWKKRNIQIQNCVTVAAPMIHPSEYRCQTRVHQCEATHNTPLLFHPPPPRRNKFPPFFFYSKMIKKKKHWIKAGQSSSGWNWQQQNFFLMRSGYRLKTARQACPLFFFLFFPLLLLCALTWAGNAISLIAIGTK